MQFSLLQGPTVSRVELESDAEAVVLAQTAYAVHPDAVPVLVIERPSFRQVAVVGAKRRRK